MWWNLFELPTKSLLHIEAIPDQGIATLDHCAVDLSSGLISAYGHHPVVARAGLLAP